MERVEIREVWAHNLQHEFKIIRDMIGKYNHIAMDTEYPGTIIPNPNPMYCSATPNEIYDVMKSNVSGTNMIQLGLTLSTSNGDLPIYNGKSVSWQFNFKEFNPAIDKQGPGSVEFLARQGVDYEKNMKYGVDSNIFGELLMSSGAVMNDEVSWVTFHCTYDFSYLIKILTRKNMLPKTLPEFMAVVNIYFRNVFDAKFLYNDQRKGLKYIANVLGLKRVGKEHNAGSDSLLTMQVFVALRDRMFGGDVRKFGGQIHGLGVINC